MFGGLNPSTASRVLILLPGDGLRHFAYQKEAIFYNGVTLDDIHGEDATNMNGIGGEWER
jgi:hypothetical protein